MGIKARSYPGGLRICRRTRELPSLSRPSGRERRRRVPDPLLHRAGSAWDSHLLGRVGHGTLRWPKRFPLRASHHGRDREGGFLAVFGCDWRPDPTRGLLLLHVYRVVVLGLLLRLLDRRHDDRSVDRDCDPDGRVDFVLQRLHRNRWKRDFLDVPGEILDRFGAVSEETIRSMLDGLATRYGVGCGIAVSGIAGPGGGTPDKPVGLVLIGTAVGPARQVRTLHFRGDRDEVRRRTVFAALNQLRMNLLPQTVHSAAANHQ